MKFGETAQLAHCNCQTDCKLNIYKGFIEEGLVLG